MCSIWNSVRVTTPRVTTSSAGATVRICAIATEVCFTAVQDCYSNRDLHHGNWSLYFSSGLAHQTTPSSPHHTPQRFFASPDHNSYPHPRKKDTKGHDFLIGQYLWSKVLLIVASVTKPLSPSAASVPNSLFHATLSMLWFCHATKYHMWHVDAVRHQGAESTLHSLEHVPFLQMESSLDQTAQRWKRSTDTEKVKQNGGLFDSNVFFLHLPLLNKVQTKCDGSKEKQVILALRAWVHHHTGHHYIDPGKLRSKHRLLSWPSVYIRPSTSWGNGNHRVACWCSMPALNPAACCRNLGLQSLVLQLLKPLHSLLFEFLIHSTQTSAQLQCQCHFTQTHPV